MPKFEQSYFNSMGVKMTTKRQMLRSEAAAVSLNSLTLSQLQAFAKLAKLLDEALDNSDGASGNRQISRLAFVSGAKGTGKSSLVHTLEKACRHKDDLKSKISKIKFKLRESEPKSNNSTARSTNMAEWKNRSNDVLEALSDIPESFHREPRKCTHIRWLKPLSLDPLPQGTNLLAAVMARIEVAVNEVSTTNRQRYGSLDPYGHIDRARHQLSSLKTEAVKALEGNLELHAATMDTTTHAIAATEAELSKVTLGDKLDSVLDSVLISHSEDGRGEPANMPGMFVMFIDDLNLCPSKAVEVVKLAHLLSSRRLFYIFLGEIEDLTKTLLFKIQGDLKKLLGVADRSIELRNIETDANEIAFSLIRKLIPENQRIHVSDMTVPEALDYDYLAGQHKNDEEPKLTLGYAINRLPPFPNDLVSSQPKNELSTWQELWTGSGSVKVEEGSNNNLILIRKNSSLSNSNEKSDGNEKENSSNLNSFSMFKPAGWFQVRDLLDKHVGHCYSQANEVIYDGANVLKSTPRHIGDALHLLDVSNELIDDIRNREKKYRDSTNNEAVVDNDEEKALVFKLENATHKITEWLFNMFKGHVGEDGQLTISVQKRLRGCVEKHKVWELSPANMRVVAYVGDTLAIQPLEWRNTLALSPVNMTLGIGRVLRFDIEARKDRNDWHDRNDKEPEYAVLGSRTRPSFKLVHDFMLFSGTGVLTETLPYKNLEDIASIRWATGYGQQEVQIPWAALPWRTFWRSDIFRDLWNHTFETARTMTRGNAVLDRTELLAFLATSWISATLITLDAQPGDLGMFDCQDDDMVEAKSKLETEQQTNERKITSLRDWGAKILGTKLFEDSKGQCACSCNSKEERDLWADVKNPQVENFGQNISEVIKFAFNTLVTRRRNGNNDLYTQTLNEKIIEIVLMCMPESGPMMFFTQNMAYGHADNRISYKAKAFANNFLVVAKTIACQMIELKNPENSENPESPENPEDTIRSGIYYDIIRVVRQKRLRNFGEYVTTHFGIGLLFMNERAFRGISLATLKIPVSGSKNEENKLSCFVESVTKEMKTLFMDSMPRLGSFYTVYQSYCKTDNLLDPRKGEISAWLEKEMESYRKKQEEDLSQENSADAIEKKHPIKAGR